MKKERYKAPAIVVVAGENEQCVLAGSGEDDDERKKLNDVYSDDIIPLAKKRSYTGVAWNDSL